MSDLISARNVGVQGGVHRWAKRPLIGRAEDREEADGQQRTAGVTRNGRHHSGTWIPFGGRHGGQAASGACPAERAVLCGPDGPSPLHLVPTRLEVIVWATAGPCSFAGSAQSPAGVDLEDDPALQRLIAFVDSHQCVRVLAEIEDQLNQQDPEFSDLFRNHPLPRIVGRWHVFSLAHLGLLVAVLLALALAHPLAYS